MTRQKSTIKSYYNTTANICFQTYRENQLYSLLASLRMKAMLYLTSLRKNSTNNLTDNLTRLLKISGVHLFNADNMNLCKDYNYFS